MPRLRPLLARLADWVSALGAEQLAEVSPEAHAHLGPLSRFAERAAHQMAESDEHLYAELTPTGSGAWGRLHADVTSQLTAVVELPDGAQTLPMPAVRGLATDADPAVRRAAYDAELARLATGRGAGRCGVERDQGRGERRQPSPQLAFTVRCVALLEQRQPGHVRRHAVRGRRITPRLPPLDEDQSGPPRARGRAGLRRGRASVVGSGRAAPLQRR